MTDTTAASSIKRFWRITAYTPFCGEEKIAYYSGTSEAKMHKFAQEVTEDNANEWWDSTIEEDYGMDEVEYYGECGYGFEEISYETFREECGY